MVDVNIDFIFRYCRDIEKIRKFYSEIVGMEEGGYSKEHGYLLYNCNGVQMVFNVGEGARVLTDFSNQPGQNKGKLQETSFAVRVPESNFQGIVDKCREENIAELYEDVRWNGYWSFIVQDPMGVTIDIYFEPEQEPESKEWTEQ